MSGLIPQQFIDDLMTRVDIVEIVDARVPLRKSGREYAACCPFHDEKTPSFTVSPTKQFYHCFGCGAHGTAIGFLMAYEHKDFVEVVEELAALAGMQVPREGGAAPATPKNDRLFPILKEAAHYYQQQLKSHPAAAKAVDYLKGRGLSGAIAAEYGLGYAPPGWDNLLAHLQQKGWKEQDVSAAGLSVDKGDRRYDRFRDRVMFPIRDGQGRVIAFGGRVLGDEKPKYLNSPETGVFHKGRELYGLHEARHALRELPRLLVVEGYMDVVSLAQFDIRFAVATLGTAVTPEHLNRLFRICPEVIFCFDGDRAGRDAAWRGLQNALPLMRDGRQVRFMFLPEGEDPDTLVRKGGATGFEARIVSAVPLSEFFFRHITSMVDMASLDGRARLIETARPLLARVPEGAFRELMTQQLADVARMELQPLRNLLSPQAPAEKAVQAAPVPRPGARRKRATGAATLSPVRQAIRLLLHEPKLAGLVPEPGLLTAAELPGVRLLVAMLEFVQRNPHVTTGAVLEHWRGSDEGQHLMRLAAVEVVLGEPEQLEAEFRGTIELLHRERERRRRELLLKKPFKELTLDEKQELQQLLKRETSGNA